MCTPRRRGMRFGALAALLLVLPACSDGDESLDPQVRAPNTGTYAYDALIHTAADAEPDTFAGTLSIAVSSEDSIVGTWSVDGFDDPARGVWNITAYTLPVDPTPPLQGTLTHRVWRQNGSGNLACNVTYERVQMPADTFTSTSENSCTLVRSGS